MNMAVELQATQLADIPLQQASLDIWDTKYRLKTRNGEAVDTHIGGTYERVATALAAVEAPERRQYWHDRFLWALHRGAIPAGRIMSNAGAEDHKPATSTINCTVSGPIQDSMHDILRKVHEAGLTLKAGCGIGYEFSTLRPRGAYVSGAGAHTSGPLSFMDIYDRMCFTVSSAGGRRGAQMGTFDVGHPDAMDFVRAKREDGRLRQFNLSLLITDEFIEAVKQDRRSHFRSRSARWRKMGSIWRIRSRSYGVSGRRRAITSPIRTVMWPAECIGLCRHGVCGTSSCRRPTISPNRVSFSSIA
jgi:ribonucleoside-diphosphate reductase alpha chain